MNYANIKLCDIANGPGVRTSLFVSGCTHRCKGCFNEIAWPFDYGEAFTEEVEDRLIESVRPEWIDGITLLGGEPLEPLNQGALVDFLLRFRHELPGKTVWCFTGWTLEQLLSRQDPVTEQLLSLVDVLVDGPFVEEQKDITLRFRGSANQRILDMKSTLTEGKPVLWQDQPVYAAHAFDPT